MQIKRQIENALVIFLETLENKRTVPGLKHQYIFIKVKLSWNIVP